MADMIRSCIRRASLAAFIGLSLHAPLTASAHHSFAMFDKTRVVKVQGTVSKVEWRNPHVFLFVRGKDPAGKAAEYAIECASVNDLTHHGWKIGMVKAGDRVTVEIYPLRDGNPGGLLDAVTLANGATIKQ
jgi:hypothetical protein